MHYLCTWKNIINIVQKNEILSNNEKYVLQCTSTYPCPENYKLTRAKIGGICINEDTKLSFKLELVGEANLVALLAVLFGAVQMAVGCSFIARVFYLRKKCNWNQMRGLRG